MKSIDVLKIAHIAYLAILMFFVLTYFLEYRPQQVRKICAEKSAQEVLKYSGTVDPYDYYRQLSNSCYLQKIAILSWILDK